MNDTTKLRPEDLTSEERALFHQAAVALLATGNYEVKGAQLDAMEYVKSSRALFAPAPSEAAKVECNPHNHVWSWGECQTCKPAQPEPAEPVTYVDNLLGQIATEAAEMMEPAAPEKVENDSEQE